MNEEGREGESDSLLIIEEKRDELLMNGRSSVDKGKDEWMMFDWQRDT